jgi:hypothetical protein
MSRGEVIEMGKHNELIDKKGTYANLVNTQALRESDAEEHDTTENLAVKDDSVSLPSTRVENGAVVVSVEADPASPKSLKKEKSGFDVLAEKSATPNHGETELMVRMRKKKEEEEKKKKESEAALKKPIPWGRLIRMSRPDFLVLLGGCITSAMIGLIFPIFSLVCSPLFNYSTVSNE